MRTIDAGRRVCVTSEVLTAVKRWKCSSRKWSKCNFCKFLLLFTAVKCVDLLIDTNVSEKHTASISRAKGRF